MFAAVQPGQIAPQLVGGSSWSKTQPNMRELQTCFFSDPYFSFKSLLQILESENQYKAIQGRVTTMKARSRGENYNLAAVEDRD